MSKPHLFSGIQPTGNLHLGNYFGMIKNALPLQEAYASIFCIVDLHALTIPRDPAELRQSIIKVARHYLASGIDPKKSTLFVQSSVPEHSELAWLLSTTTKMAELERMTQFKEKAAQHRENINLGLFSYPVLMAADILLYNTAAVPVGEDQRQHLELARTLASRFNKQYKKIFLVPKALIKSREEGSRLMGLDDPTKKMSKSAAPANYVALDEDPELAAQKIRKATTDSGTEIKTDQNKPGISNLLTIYSLVKNTSIGQLEEKYRGKTYKEFKEDLAEEVKQFLENHQQKMAELDDSYIVQILAEGATRAKKIAHEKMLSVKKAMGIL